MRIGRLIALVLCFILGTAFADTFPWEWGAVSEGRTAKGGFRFHADDAPGKYALAIRGRTRDGRRLHTRDVFEMDTGTTQLFNLYAFGRFRARMIRIDSDGDETTVDTKRLRVHPRFKAYAPLHAGNIFDPDPDPDPGDGETRIVICNDSGSNRNIDRVRIFDAGGGSPRWSRDLNIAPGNCDDDGTIELEPGFYDIVVETTDGGEAWFLNERIKSGETRRISVFQRIQ